MTGAGNWCQQSDQAEARAVDAPAKARSNRYKSTT